MMLIKGENLHYQYPKAKSPILKGVNFEIEKGRCVLFIGKSGSGKTTILRCLMKLVTHTQGGIVASSQLKIGFVSQGWDLFPHMTALENCIHPQKHVLGRNKKEAEEKTLHLFELLEIQGCAHKHPHQLSGGQKQRVAIARALGMDAELLLFDEPTSALDPQSTKQFRTLIKQLQAQGMTLVISTHDMSFVKSCLDKVYLLQEGTLIDSYDAKQGELSFDSPIFHYIYTET